MLVSTCTPSLAQVAPLTKAARPLPLDPDFKAVLAVRPSVSAAETSMVPVLLSVIATGTKNIPDLVTLHCDDFETLVYGDQRGASINVPTTDPMRLSINIEITKLSMLDAGPDSLRLWVTALNNPDDYLCQMTTVNITGEFTQVDIISAPKTIIADGVTTAKLMAKITDINGKPLANIPCIVGWSGPDVTIGTDKIGTSSDDKGLVTFVIPASKESGKGNVEVDAKFGNVQAHFDYVDPKTSSTDSAKSTDNPTAKPK